MNCKLGKTKNIIIGCEYSGIVRDEFIKRGYNAISCDLLETDKPGPHYKGNILELLKKKRFDLGIFHPPCTFLSNSGVCHLYTEPERWKLLIEGAVFFRTLMLIKEIPLVAVENPIQHKYARQIIGKDPAQIIQPYMFGHPEKKATCLWLKNLPPLQETNNVKKEMELLPKNKQQRLHYLSNTPDRWKIRSTTFSGIAEAMAEQWGGLI